jgi:uncharacterized protein (TIGR04168 family)
MVNIAVIGDIHGHFTIEDVDYFNRSDYDLILVVGDLVDWWLEGALKIASFLAQIRKPILFIPGNHDSVHPLQLLAEMKRNRLGIHLTSIGHSRRSDKLRERLEPVGWCGYSTHSFVVRGLAFDIVAGRPFSMGGPYLSFLPFLRRNYDVSSMSASAQRIKHCVDVAESDNLIFFAHNGPSGLGSNREDIWGCDFLPEEGDYGDPDLEEAIVYARYQGKNVIAVVAGHMHLHLQGGGKRRWLVEHNKTVYINSAEVPRIFKRGGDTVHYHLGVMIEGSQVNVTRVLI